MISVVRSMRTEYNANRSLSNADLTLCGARVLTRGRKMSYAAVVAAARAGGEKPDKASVVPMPEKKKA
mgnify:CR=1 FL=1